MYFEQERAKAGTHFHELRSPLSGADTQRVLRGIITAGLLPFLERHPLHALYFAALRAPLGTPAPTGLYHPQTAVITLNILRPEGSYGLPFQPGILWSVSYAGQDRTDAMKRSIVHELGHHMLNCSDDSIYGTLREAFLHPSHYAITQLGSDNWRENFCEHHAAYVFHRKAL